MPYLVQKYFGEGWAVAISVACVLLGLYFLITAHLESKTAVGGRTSPIVSWASLWMGIKTRMEVDICIGDWLARDHHLGTSPHGHRALQTFSQMVSVVVETNRPAV